MRQKRKEYQILYDTLNYLISNKKIKEETFTICEQALSVELMEFNNVKNILSQVISIDDYVISLNNDIISVFEKIPYFLAHFEVLKKMDVEDILIKIEQYAIKCTNIDELLKHYIYILSMLLTVDYKANSFDEKYYISHFVYSMLNCKKNIELIGKLDDYILESFKENRLDSICDNDYLLALYNLSDIFTIKELIESNDVYKIIFINYDEIKIHKLFDVYSVSKKDNISEYFNSVLMKLTPREEKCFRLKYGIDDGVFRSLEGVGKFFGLTRERIRQMIAKCEAKVYAKLQTNYLYFECLYNSFKNEKNYWFCSEKLDYFENDFNIRMFLATLDILNICNVKFNLCMVYDKDKNYEDIIEEIIASKPRIISIQDFNSENDSIKIILKERYNYNGEAYLKKGSNYSCILSEVLENHFNKVIDLKSDDFKKIKKIFKKDYYMDISNMTEHSLKAILHRLDYYPIGQSKFMHFEEFVIIPNDLLVDIITYLNEINSPILYSMLYERFKNELIEIGITNFEYFKSVIDLKIKDDFNLSKSYIKPLNETRSAVDIAISTIRSINGVFEFRDVKEVLPYYSDVSLNIFLSKELSNDLLLLSNKQYIYLKNVNIEEEVISELKIILSELLDKNNGVISVNNLFLKIYYEHEELLNKLGIFKNSFNLFSLCKELFNNDFNFKRPLIFKKEIATMNVYELIVKKLSSSKEITFENIKNQNLTLGTTQTSYNKIQISELISETFMMYDENKFINRDFYQIDSSTLLDIKTMLNLIIKREKQIDTKKFKSYGLLPRIKYVWNKYLLLGVIHCYFSEEYEIVKQSETRTFEFIVRRLIHE